MRNCIRLIIVATATFSFKIHSFYGLVSHDTANADGRRPALSEHIELEDYRGAVGFLAYARREQILTDRTLTNALTLAAARADFPGHSFHFGLGAHYRQLALGSRKSEPGIFSPAVGFTWSASAFRAEIAGAEVFQRAAFSYLAQLALPIEFGSDWENASSQPMRWSLNAYFHLSTHVGFIAGYEPLAAHARAGLWVSPVEGFSARCLARIHAQLGAQWEFSLSYQLENSASPVVQPPAVPTQTSPVQTRKAKTTPAFATLVKWGLSPVEALRFVREKDVCALSAAAQSALQKHRWECRNRA